MEEGLGSLFTEPVELESNKLHVMITAGGVDKPGLVAQLTRSVALAEGSITHSRMVRLGTDFIMTMHAAVPPEKMQSFTKALQENKELESLNLQFNHIQPRPTDQHLPPQIAVRLRAIGADRYVFLCVWGFTHVPMIVRSHLYTYQPASSPLFDFILENQPDRACWHPLRKHWWPRD
jgi:predicted amino acid-binding ACT domain protein